MLYEVITKFDDIRHILFDSEIYDNIFVRDVMFMPSYVIFTHDPVEEVARKFQVSVV